jgi:hypothetical protein
MRKSGQLLLALAALLPLNSAARGQSLDHFSSPLSQLAEPKEGAAMHEGSWDRTGGNADMRRVEPGQSLTLFDHQGAGCVHRFWVTIAPRADMKIHAQAILRMYWDGEENPSVECPIGAFFGVGFGQQKDFTSLPLNETSGGYNCYWPMPFHKSAHWTIENKSDKPIDAFYYNIDYTALDSIPQNARHFHAQFRRENPTSKDKNYTILETSGAGHYVGTALFMQGIRPRNISFLEGDEMVYIDGAEKPSIIGTGTEDYFSSGWYYDHGPYSAPYHGCVIKDEKIARISTYRWHIEDTIPFKKSIRFTIEHGTNNECTADYSSVAYYYLAGPTPKGPVLPANLLPTVPPEPFKIKGAIEGENLKDSATATAGDLEIQNMDIFGEDWSGGAQLFWTPREPNAELTLNVPAPSDGEYTITARMTTAPDYGIIQFTANGKAIGGALDLYSRQVEHKDFPLGTVTLKKEKNAVVVKNVGKNDKSRGFLVGIDAFILKPAR